jgi:hypothetical protein
VVLSSMELVIYLNVVCNIFLSSELRRGAVLLVITSYRMNPLVRLNSILSALLKLRGSPKQRMFVTHRVDGRHLLGPGWVGNR